jgi:hypothetical protein
MYHSICPSFKTLSDTHLKVRSNSQTKLVIQREKNGETCICENSKLQNTSW